MEGQSPVVWEWSSALHRGWRFLLLRPPTPQKTHPSPPPIPHHHYTPQSTYLITLIKRFSCTIEVVVVVLVGGGQLKTLNTDRIKRKNCP